MLTKAAILVHWRSGPRTIEVQYNPHEYTLDKQVTLGEITVPGLDAPLQQYVRGQAEKLIVELFFDTTDQGMGNGARSVTQLTDQIYQLLKPEPERHAPPPLTFVWAAHYPGSSIGAAASSAAGAAAGAVASAAAGAASGAVAAASAAASAATGGATDALAAVGSPMGNQQRNGFSCVLDTIKQKFTLFSPEGVPLRATLTCTFREYRPLSRQVPDRNFSSPDRSHAHVLREGDQLASVAARYYDRAAEWRPLAEANGIDDPRRLTPGRVLRVPKIV